MPKVFISHSWEDNATSRQIAEYLKSNGAEIWIDYARISGGESLPDKMNEGLEWCDTLVLIWTKAAAASYYVKLEWQCALTAQKVIIPCLLDYTKLPLILGSKLYIQFHNPETDYFELARALNLSIKKEAPKIEAVPERQPTTRPVQKLPAASKKTIAVKAPLFRSESRTMSEQDVQVILKKHDFYCGEYDWSKAYCNPNGRGFKHQYQTQTIQGDQLVLDQASGLMWQQGGSNKYMEYEPAKKWIADLNQQGYAGYKDWRLPTLEEAMSLMEREEKNGDLYIDPVFDNTQRYIWTTDPVVGSAAAWVVCFLFGSCYPNYLLSYCVRAVRSGLSSQE
ncbi:TIR domain-containing protein [candidate division KSB1 bacterium]|nr:TIR domain-containing protein [candidate division KSB1 bacterium]